MDTKIENKKVVTDELKHQNHGAGKQQQQQQPLIMCSPTSSPSHEFSFTIPLMNSSSTFANKIKPPTTTTTNPCLSAAAAMEDLSPADDIFFHGHLLPLHLLSHVPISPRNSLDIFTLPIQDLPPHHNQTSNNINNKKKDDELDTEGPRINNIRPKAKSFSIFGRSKWRKQQENENGEKEREKKKPKFEVSQMLKRYMRMVRPLLSMKSSSSSKNIIIRGGNGGNGGILQKQEAYSFSGNVSLRHDENDSSFESSSSSIRRREFSAPASMWTSPSNSGILMPKGVGGTPSYSSSTYSTMEELQAAIQAAITHCKNSIAIEQDNTKIP